jgi:hypothetical protein
MIWQITAHGICAQVAISAGKQTMVEKPNTTAGV